MRTLSCLPHSGGRWPSVARSDEGVVRFGVVPHPSRRSAVNSNGYAVTVLLSRKKAITRKILALLLSLSMVLLALPAEVGVVLATESAPSLSVTDRTLPQEEVIQRTATTKTFLMPDGTHTFVSYGTTVHKLTEDGTWDEVDNRLVLDEKTGQYVTVHGLSTVRFAKNTPSVSLETDTGRLSWSVRPEGTKAGDMAATVAVSDTTATAAYKALPAAEKAMTASKADGSLSYAVTKQAFSVDYTVSPESVKENIVITSATQNRFLITVAHEGLTPVDKGNRVVFTDQTGEERFGVSAPLMFDAVGAESEGLTLDIVSQDDTSVTLLLAADKQWVSDSERVYPVTLDPIYYSSLNGADIIDTYVHEGDAAGDHNMETRLYLGNRDGKKHYTYVKAPLDDLPAGITSFNSATFNLYLPSVTSTGGPFTLYAANGSWASGTISWNNRPSDYPGYSVPNVPIVYHSDGTRTATFDVLAFVSTVYTSSNLNNLGFRIAYTDEALSDYNSFYSAEWGTQSQRPQFTVNYNSTGATVADGVYYITNSGTEQYLTAHIALGTVTDVYQYTKFQSSAAETARIRQMWKVKFLGDGLYSIRPLYELNYGLWHNSESTAARLYPIGTTDTVSGVYGNASWTISGTSGNYAIKKQGNDTHTLHVTSTTAQETVQCGSPSNTTYAKWSFTAVSPPPSGAYMQDTSIKRVATNLNRYVAPEENRTLASMNFLAVSYSPTTISQTFTWTSSNTSMATVNASTGAVTGVSPGTATITGTSAAGETTSFSVTVTQVANGDYVLRNLFDNKCCGYDYALQAGEQLYGTLFYSDVHQEWTVARSSDNYYIIKLTNANVSYYLGVTGDSTSNNAAVVLRTGTVTDGMLWKIDCVTRDGNKNYKITPKTGEINNRVLAVNNTLLSGVLIQQRDYVNDSNLKDEWRLITIPQWNLREPDTGEPPNVMSYWEDTPVYWKSNLSSHEYFEFDNYVSSGFSSWSNVIGDNYALTTNKSYANIRVYGGSKERLKNEGFSGWDNDDMGITFYSSGTNHIFSLLDNEGNTHEATWSTLTEAEVLLFDHYNGELTNTSTAIHEIGHAVGYGGHSGNASHVMCQGSQQTVIKDPEKNFLLFFYELGR